jgi:hypothetical protein
MVQTTMSMVILIATMMIALEALIVKGNKGAQNLPTNQLVKIAMMV